MATRTPKPRKKPADRWESDNYSYRGRKVEVRKHGDHAHYRLLIDGHEVNMEQSERGILTHAMMYQEFGTPYELAEALINDWGTSKIEPTDHSDHDDHSN